VVGEEGRLGVGDLCVCVCVRVVGCCGRDLFRNVVLIDEVGDLRA